MARPPASPARRLLLINPNTSTATTQLMAQIARDEAADFDVEAMTVAHGKALITNEFELATAARAVAELLERSDLSRFSGILIAAFGDPGMQEARTRSGPPITGLAEAAMNEAPGRFAVVTTTPALARPIKASAALYGHDTRLAGVFTTPGEPAVLMASPEALLDAMIDASRRALAQSGADSIVIGGGPLARVARQLRVLLPVPVIEPIPAAVRLARLRAEPG